MCMGYMYVASTARIRSTARYTNSNFAAKHTQTQSYAYKHIGTPSDDAIEFKLNARFDEAEATRYHQTNTPMKTAHQHEEKKKMNE